MNTPKANKVENSGLKPLFFSLMYQNVTFLKNTNNSYTEYFYNDRGIKYKTKYTDLTNYPTSTVTKST